MTKISKLKMRTKQNNQVFYKLDLSFVKILNYNKFTSSLQIKLFLIYKQLLNIFIVFYWDA